MKLTTFFVLFTYFLNTKSAAPGLNEYVLQPINGINGYVQTIEFNADGNAYVAIIQTTEDETLHQLYKLGSGNQIIWGANITDSVYKIVINSYNDVYLQYTVDYEPSINVLRENPLTIAKIDDIYEFSMIIDEQDNIFYNGNEGIKLLRPKSTTPILIQRLENYYFLDDVSFAIDSKGNVYLGVMDFEGTSALLAVVSNEAKQAEIPYAIANYYLDPDYFVDCLVVDQNDDVWVFISDGYGSKILKLANGIMIHVLSDEEYENHRGLAVNDRVYVLSIAYDIPASAFFLNLNGEVHKISDLTGVVAHSFSTIELVADKSGNTYIGAYVAYKNGPVALMKPGQENATWISFPRVINVETLIVDNNDDLWVVTNDQGVFYLKQGETEAVKVLNHRGANTDLTGMVSVNKKTNEVFVLGSTHLYVITKNSA